jgi:LCP family protein required for cell wall assembly
MGGDYDGANPDRNIHGVRSDVFVVAVADVPSDTALPIAVTLISLPRDLYVPVACTPWDNGLDRINVAWHYGGWECVAETVLAATGLEGDGPMFYVVFDGFVDMVDAMGGLAITPPEDFYDFCGISGGGGDWYYLKGGRSVTLGGVHALCYVRARMHAPRGDLTRNARSAAMLQAMAEQWPANLLAGDLSLQDAVVAASKLSEYVSTEGDWMDIVQAYGLDGLAVIAGQRAVDWRTVTMTYDEVKGARTPNGASVLAPLVDVPAWVACMLDGAAPGGREICTDSTLVLP